MQNSNLNAIFIFYSSFLSCFNSRNFGIVQNEKYFCYSDFYSERKLTQNIQCAKI